MTPKQLRKPTPDLVVSYVTRFEQEGFLVADKAIFKLFQAFPHNQKIENVFVKRKQTHLMTENVPTWVG